MDPNLETLLALADEPEGYMLSGQAEDARKRDAFEAAYPPGEIGHFTMYEDGEYVRELLQPYTGDGLPDLFAIEWPEGVYVDRLLFTSEERAMAYLFRNQTN